MGESNPYQTRLLKRVPNPRHHSIDILPTLQKPQSLAKRQFPNHIEREHLQPFAQIAHLLLVYESFFQLRTEDFHRAVHATLKADQRTQTVRIGNWPLQRLVNDWVLRCEDARHGLACRFHEEGVVEVTLSNFWSVDIGHEGKRARE